MSAAEKLKGLDTLTLKNEHNVPIRSLTVAEQLVDVLPQIVAVVEAAEDLTPPDPGPTLLLDFTKGEVRGMDAGEAKDWAEKQPTPRRALARALAALDEALS